MFRFAIDRTRPNKTTATGPLMMVAVAAGMLALSGCGDNEEPPASEDTAAMQTGTSETSDRSDGGGTAQDASPPADDAIRETLGVRGWNGLRLGDVPGDRAEALGFADDGSYDDVCRIWSSDEFPGIYLIVEQFEAGAPVIARISAYEAQPLNVRTDRGIGVGSSEADVREAYAPLGEQGHAYDAAPAKDLFWGPEGSEAGLRFEIGPSGTVSVLHAGIAPTLSYVEGCS